MPLISHALFGSFVFFTGFINARSGCNPDVILVRTNHPLDRAVIPPSTLSDFVAGAASSANCALPTIGRTNALHVYPFTALAPPNHLPYPTPSTPIRNPEHEHPHWKSIFGPNV